MADVVNAVKARSMLMVLHATCQQSLLALAAAEIDPALTDDLHKLIERTETELATLKQKLDGGLAR